MLYNPQPVPILDFDAWFATDSTSTLYSIHKFMLLIGRKQAEAFDRLTKMHIVKEHKGLLYLDDNFRKQYKSALTGGYTNPPHTAQHHSYW
jgi:hypothetical protein